MQIHLKTFLVTTTEDVAPLYPHHFTHVWLTLCWNYIIIIYLLFMAGTQTCFCSLRRQKFLLWPSAALALKERLLVCLQSQNPTVKSGVVGGGCTHASKTKQSLCFSTADTLWRARRSTGKEEQRACGCSWGATSNFHIRGGCWYRGWSVIFVHRDR